MKPLLPTEIRVGVAWVTELYDFGPVSAGFEIEEDEVAYCRSVGASYVTIRTECEQAVRVQPTPQVRTGTSGSIPECAGGHGSAPQTIKKDGQTEYLLDFWALMRSFLG
jgi:hypothetical protein